MSNTHALIRSLLIYSLCLPLAIYLGYSLATPDEYETVGLVGLLLFVLLIPLFLRYHHLLLIVSWNAAAVVPLVRGQPQLWLGMAALSISFSVFGRAMRKQARFLPNLPITLPLLFLACVIVVTGHFAGGIGFRAAGSDIYGGKRYLMLLGAIIGFFALVAQPIPVKMANRCLALYLLAEVSAIIPVILTAVGPPWQYGTVLFPADMSSFELAASGSVFTPIGGVFRWVSLAAAGRALFFAMLAYYGVRRILDLRVWWRLLLLLVFVALSLFGGFRSVLILMLLTFGVMFWTEGLWRTRLLPVLVGISILGGAILLPTAEKLPQAVQRTLSFLPLNIDPAVRVDAEYSSEWRIRLWKTVLPEIPRYLWLGKGYTINPQDIELAQTAANRSIDSSEVSMLAGDYHNGPLSVIIPLGVFGAIGFLWFLGASTWVLWRNRTFGEPNLKYANTFLFAAFVAKMIFFFLIYGSLYAEFFQFTGLVGLSISLNGGIGKAAATQPNVDFGKFRIADVAPGM